MGVVLRCSPGSIYFPICSRLLKISAIPAVPPRGAWLFHVFCYLEFNLGRFDLVLVHSLRRTLLLWRVASCFILSHRLPRVASHRLLFSCYGKGASICCRLTAACDGRQSRFEARRLHHALSALHRVFRVKLCIKEMRLS